MAHVNCPNCGKRLRFPDTSKTVRVRCPACKHTFQTSPVPQSSKVSDYTEAGLGRFAKTAVAVTALAGTALLVFLVYKVASRPGRNEKPPQQLAQAVKTPENASTAPTTTITPPAPQLPQVTSKPAAMSPEELFAKASPAVVRVVVRDKDFKPIGIGSGFFISEDGLLVTNYHVIEKAEFATVLLSNNATLFVDGVAATDAKADLALLKVNGKDLPHLTVAGEKPPKVGAKVYAIGNPRGLTNTLSEGIVSGLRKVKEGLALIQTTASISKGSSGGPLLTPDGKVVGVTSAYLSGGQNLNFAVPAGQVHRLIRKRGKLRTLASAGGKRLDKTTTKELDKAWAAMAKKDWRTATKILIKLRKTQKDNPFVWYALGYLHGELKNHKIAIQHYRVAISLKPDFAAAYYNMAIDYTILDIWADAITSFEKVLTLCPRDIWYCMKIGWICRRHAAFLDLEATVKMVDTGFKSRTHPDIPRLRATEKAAFRRATAFKPNSPMEYYRVAEAHVCLEEYREALAVCRKAVRVYPGASGAYSLMARVYRYNLKQPADALRVYEEALTKVRNKRIIYSDMGDHYRQIGRHTEAAKAYRNAIAIKPTPWLYSHLGGAYRKIRRYTDAIDAYRKAIALRRDSGKGEEYGLDYMNLGDVYQEAKRYKEAIEAYKIAVGLFMREGDSTGDLFAAVTYGNMGETYRKLKRYSEAVEAFKKAIGGEATGSRTYFNLGETYREWGRHAEAISAYESAIRTDYTGEIAKKARARIAEMRRR